MEPQNAHQKFTTHTAALATWEMLVAKGYVSLVFGTDPPYPASNDLESCCECGNRNVI